MESCHCDAKTCCIFLMHCIIKKLPIVYYTHIYVLVRVLVCCVWQNERKKKHEIKSKRKSLKLTTISKAALSS